MAYNFRLFKYVLILLKIQRFLASALYAPTHSIISRGVARNFWQGAYKFQGSMSGTHTGNWRRKIYILALQKLEFSSISYLFSGYSTNSGGGGQCPWLHPWSKFGDFYLKYCKNEVSYYFFPNFYVNSIWQHRRIRKGNFPLTQRSRDRSLPMRALHTAVQRVCPVQCRHDS